MTAVDATSSWTVLIPGFLLAGAGIGLVNPPLASTAIGVVPHERSGMASGINATFRQVGIATGIAGLGAIFQHRSRSGTTSALALERAGAAKCSAPRTASSATLLDSGEVGQARALALRAPRAPRSSTPTASASPSASRRSR